MIAGKGILDCKLLPLAGDGKQLSYTQKGTLCEVHFDYGSHSYSTNCTHLSEATSSMLTGALLCARCPRIASCQCVINLLEIFWKFENLDRSKFIEVQRAFQRMAGQEHLEQ